MAQPHPQSTAPIDSVLSSADRAWLLTFSAWRMEEGAVSAHPPKKTIWRDLTDIAEELWVRRKAGVQFSRDSFQLS